MFPIEEEPKVVIKYPRDKSLSAAQEHLRAENLASVLYRFFKGGTYMFTTESTWGGATLKAYLPSPTGPKLYEMGEVNLGRKYVTITLYLR